MYRVFLIVMLLFATVFVSADEISDKCGTHPNLYRDAVGKPIWLSAEQMLERAVAKAKPEPVNMANFKYEGAVSLKVMVDRSGDVVCMWDVAGHPIMIPSAVRAAHDWKFKPMRDKGEAVEYVGFLKVPVSTK